MRMALDSNNDYTCRDKKKIMVEFNKNRINLETFQNILLKKRKKIAERQNDDDGKQTRKNKKYVLRKGEIQRY